LAQLIVKQIVEANADPNELLLYNPVNWANASNVFFAPGTDWLQPPVKTVINGRQDAFSQRSIFFLPESSAVIQQTYIYRLGEECAASDFPTTPPTEALFDPKKVVIVSNGR